VKGHRQNIFTSQDDQGTSCRTKQAIHLNHPTPEQCFSIFECWKRCWLDEG